MNIRWEAVEEYLKVLLSVLFDFTQFVVLGNFIKFGLGDASNERVNRAYTTLDLSQHYTR